MRARSEQALPLWAFEAEFGVEDEMRWLRSSPAGLTFTTFEGGLPSLALVERLCPDGRADLVDVLTERRFTTDLSEFIGEAE